MNRQGVNRQLPALGIETNDPGFGSREPVTMNHPAFNIAFTVYQVTIPILPCSGGHSRLIVPNSEQQSRLYPESGDILRFI
jgi:hypothetical protein